MQELKKKRLEDEYFAKMKEMQLVIKEEITRNENNNNGGYEK